MKDVGEKKKLSFILYNKSSLCILFALYASLAVLFYDITTNKSVYIEDYNNGKSAIVIEIEKTEK
jgi:hypothetical protein